MLNRNPTATEISEHLLDLTGKAIMCGDLDGFTECIALPFTLETAGGVRCLTSKADFVGIFEAVRSHLLQMGITMLARHCVAAEFKSQNLVAATHETRLISSGLLVEEPFPTLSALVKEADGQWRVKSSTYEVQKDSIYWSAFDL